MVFYIREGEDLELRVDTHHVTTAYREACKLMRDKKVDAVPKMLGYRTNEKLPPKYFEIAIRRVR